MTQETTQLLDRHRWILPVAFWRDTLRWSVLYKISCIRL